MIKLEKKKSKKIKIRCSQCNKEFEAWEVEGNPTGFYIEEETLKHKTKHKKKVVWFRVEE